MSDRDVPRGILRELCLREARLQELRATKSVENQSELKRLIGEMKAQFTQLIVMHSNYAQTSSKDVHGMLWKQCFYKQIEDFRRSFRNCEKRLTQASEGEDEEAMKNSQHHMTRLATAFHQFLTESELFYLDLMKALEEKTALTASKEDLVRSVHKCLLCLGDLVRYREQHSEGSVKDFHQAEGYYQRAAFLLPSSGNAQNQLAVLSMYSNCECVAVFHYCRSILVRQPCVAGFDNLDMIFDKNAKSCRELMSKQAPNFPPGKDQAKKINAYRLQLFLVQFVRLHGMLYEWTKHHLRSGAPPPPLTTTAAAAGAYSSSQEEEVAAAARAGPGGVGGAAEGSSTASSLSATPAPAFDIEAFLTLHRETFSHFDHLLPAGIFGDGLLVRLLIISIFSIHQGVPPVPGVEADKGVLPRSRGPRTIAESLALINIYTLVSKVSSRLSMLTTGGSGGGGGGGGGNSGAALSGQANRLLPLLSVFAEWASLYSANYLMACFSSLSGEGFGAPHYYSSMDLLRAEGRARSGMRSAFSMLKSYFEGSGGGAVGGGVGAASRTEKPRTSSAADTAPLWEHIDLRGFLPLVDQYERYFVSTEALPRMPVPISDDPARERRLRTLKAFVRDWVVPCAERETKEAENRRIDLRLSGMLVLQAGVVPAAGGGGQEKKKQKEKQKRGQRGEEEAKRKFQDGEKTRSSNKQTRANNKSKKGDSSSSEPLLLRRPLTDSGRTPAFAGSAIFTSRDVPPGGNPFAEEAKEEEMMMDEEEEEEDEDEDDEEDADEEGGEDLGLGFGMGEDKQGDANFYIGSSLYSSSGSSLLSIQPGSSFLSSFPPAATTTYNSAAFSSNGVADGGQMVDDGDEDDADDEVVFRPRFTRGSAPLLDAPPPLEQPLESGQFGLGIGLGLVGLGYSSKPASPALAQSSNGGVGGDFLLQQHQQQQHTFGGMHSSHGSRLSDYGEDIGAPVTAPNGGGGGAAVWPPLAALGVSDTNSNSSSNNLPFSSTGWWGGGGLGGGGVAGNIDTTTYLLVDETADNWTLNHVANLSAAATATSTMSYANAAANGNGNASLAMPMMTSSYLPAASLPPPPGLGKIAPPPGLPRTAPPPREGPPSLDPRFQKQQQQTAPPPLTSNPFSYNNHLG